MMTAVGFVVALSLSQAAPPLAAGRIAGRVMMEGANTPIAGARVMLMPSGQPTGPMGMPSMAVTDANGRFVIAAVAAGNYHVNVQKAGYAQISDPAEPPLTITMAAGQSLDDVMFRLQKGGAITGRVIDANGEPVPEVSIMAMRRSPSSAAADRFFPGPMQGGQLTNDIGEFRIAGLAPGEYVVAAATAVGFSPFGGMNVAPPIASGGRSTAATTYYPGTADRDAAGAIVITPGAEVGSIVFSLQTVPAFDVSGIVVDESGSPIAHAMVTLMGDPRSGMFGPSGSAQSQDDGRFVIGGVPAGTYQVNATIMIMGGAQLDPTVAGHSGGSVAWSSGAAGGSGAGFFSFSAGGPIDPAAEVVIIDGDVENVRVVTRRPGPQ